MWLQMIILKIAIDVIAGKYGQVVDQLVEAVRKRRRDSWVSQKSIDNNESELASSNSSKWSAFAS